jgi:hypothetical protein
MSKYEIPFLTACIQAFGRRFSMTRQAAFRYLHKHKGLAFLIEFYDVEHLQSMDETIDDLQAKGMIRGNWRDYIKTADSIEQIGSILGTD